MSHLSIQYRSDSVLEITVRDLLHPAQPVQEADVRITEILGNRDRHVDGEALPLLMTPVLERPGVYRGILSGTLDGRPGEWLTLKGEIRSGAVTRYFELRAVVLV